jgi:chaperone required for assembly of F1-ATPase
MRPLIVFWDTRHMRDILEDAIEHRDDGYGRAQKHARRALAKRFYEKAEVVAGENGFAIALDGRPVRTPGRKKVEAPTAELAEALAAEWAAQDKHIDPELMPLTRLVNAAVEGGEAAIPGLIEELVKFAANDLLFYRADSPRELVAEQEKHWDAALVTLARKYDIAFQPTVGIIHQPQPQATLARLRQVVETEPALVLAALVSATGLTGSALLAIGLRDELFTPDQVWRAANLDEDFQWRLWGEDAEAADRRARRRAEFDAASTVLRLAARG